MCKYTVESDSGHLAVPVIFTCTCITDSKTLMIVVLSTSKTRWLIILFAFSLKLIIELQTL